MKKMTVVLLIVVLLCCMLLIPAHADDEDNTPLRDVLINKNTEMVDDFMDPDLFQESMEGVVWEDQPILFVFTRPLYHCTEMTLDEILQDSFQNWSSQIVILHDDPIGISRYKSKTKIGAFDFPVYRYLQDILDGKAIQEFLGEKCHINNVFFFGIHTDNNEHDVLYVTDKGLYVRCYANGSAEPIEYDWDSYCVIARAYHDYISSYEYNFDENGNIIAGGNLSFLEFAENPTKYVPDYGKEPQDNTLTWILAGAGVVAVTATAATILLFRRKRKCATEQ